MKLLSRRLEKKRRSLLRRYDAENLHALRVTLRRMRSRLKQIPGKKARKLRRDLGVLADATNGARDWDTLMINAERSLSRQQYAALAPLLKNQQGAAHDRVLAMLQSKEWSAAVRRWVKYEQRKAQLQEDGDSDSARELARTQQKLLTAKAKAFSHNDDTHWHKLRIAIKDLRYQLDVTPKNARSAKEREILTLCKALQVDLGEWHDTVVHRQLLRGLTDRLQAAPGLTTARDSLASLVEALQQQGRDYIEQVRSRLEQAQSVLVPEAEGA